MRKALLVPLLVAVLAACSSTPVNSTQSVCTDFAKFIKEGRPASQRADVVRSLGKVISQADKKVQDAFPTLTRTVTGTTGAQHLADDTFAQACFDAGWKG